MLVIRAMPTHTPHRTRPDLVDELPRLQATLLDDRRFRREQLTDLAAGRPDQSGSDTSSDTGRGEVAAALVAGARQALADVEAALARIEGGTYGSCLTCGARLGLAHLRDVPEMASCFRCRERAHPG